MKKIVILVLVALLVVVGAVTYFLAANTASVTTEQNVAVETDGRTHVIRFVDPEGKPVPGVMANVCDDASCTLLTVDDEGVAHFSDLSGEENHAYELQILKVPEGFVAPQDEKLPLNETGETVVTLNRE